VKRKKGWINIHNSAIISYKKRALHLDVQAVSVQVVCYDCS